MSFTFTPNGHDTEVVQLGGEAFSVSKSLDTVIKDSQQQPPLREKMEVLPFVNPRVSFDTLLFFMEVNSWHARCVRLKARLVGGMGWMLATDDEDKEEDDQYNAIMSMLKNPQSKRREGEQRQTFGEIIVRFLTDYYATGNAFLEIPRNLKGEVAELYHMMAITTRRDRKLNGGYHQVERSQSQVHLRGFKGESPMTNEVLHFMEYDPKDPWYGTPAWAPAMGSMLLDRTQVEYNTYLFQNGLMAHFAVVVEGGKLSSAQIDSLKSFLQTNATGVQNAGRGIVLQNESSGVTIKIEKLNMDIKDKQIIEGRNMTRDEVISVHGVPPRLLGIMSAGQLGGGGEVQGQLHTFLETVIRPEQERLESFLNEMILSSFSEQGLDGVKWRIKFNSMDISDPTKDAEFWTKALSPTTGWLSQDEVRENQGLTPLEVSTEVESVTDDTGDLADPAELADLVKSLRERVYGA